MFKIKWRGPCRPGRVAMVVTGISRYTSRKEANLQVERWKLHFPDNHYFVVPE
jgi:hypothetical protein